MVYDLTADSVLYRHGERQLMRPASTMKLVTAVTAIDVLGETTCIAPPFVIKVR